VEQAKRITKFGFHCIGNKEAVYHSGFSCNCVYSLALLYLPNDVLFFRLVAG